MIPPSPDKKIYASGAMKQLSINNTGNIVKISSEVYIMDKRPDVSYVWSIRILDPDNHTVLFEKLYDHQIFKMPPSHEMNATFNDIVVIPVPDGIYLIQVAAFKILPRFGLQGLRDDRLTKGVLRGPQGTKKIMIINN